MSAARRKKRPRLLLLLYNLLYPFVLLVMLPGFFVRMMRRGNYRHKFGQRFGIYSRRVRRRVEGRDWTWIHAVSVGECLIALKLIDQLKALDPSLNIVLATTTSTGFALARKTAETRDWMEVIYNPLDFIIPVRRALALFRPRRLVLVEAEVWPNMVSQVTQRGTPSFLVNARMSPRSGRRYRKFRWFTGPIFRLLDVICVQEREDVDRWMELGADPRQIQLTGSIKFDQPPAASSRAGEFREILRGLGIPDDARVLLGGSTFAGEEEILTKLYRELKAKYPDLFLILVPRHFERTQEILRELEPLGLSIVRRTTLATRHSNQSAEASAKEKLDTPDVLLVDTTGELRDWYHLATVTFIGKSLKATGGQNPVEAVMAGKPVIFGPHMENFASIVRSWLASDAAIQVADAKELAAKIDRLLWDAAERDRLASNAREAVAVHQGATDRTARVILDFRA